VGHVEGHMSAEMRNLAEMQTGVPTLYVCPGNKSLSLLSHDEFLVLENAATLLCQFFTDGDIMKVRCRVSFARR